MQQAAEEQVAAEVSPPVMEEGTETVPVADIVQKKGALEKGISRISKPVAPHVLLNKIREVLDAPSTVSSPANPDQP